MKLVMDRRKFLAGLGAVAAMGAAGMAGTGGSGAFFVPDGKALAETEFPKPARGQKPEARIDPQTGDVEVNDDVIVRYSMCLGCYSSCGNRVKLDRETGRVLTVGGNPYHPSCAYPYLHFEDSLIDAYKTFGYANPQGDAVRATVCGRGQGTQDAYSHADRITMPLKRAGKRGEGKWKAISWDQLIQEVCEGGKLFADIGEDRDIEGFKAIHDTKTLLNPDQPDLGPISNQLVMLGGRSDGRTIIGNRFISAFGSMNAYGHGSSCGGPQAQRAFTETPTTLLVQPDLENAEYILWMGTFPGANGRNFQSIAKRSSKLLKKGAKMDVLDPVLGGGIVTPSAGDDIRWVPIRADADVPFSLAMIRWMMEHHRVNTTFVSYANYQAAWDAGYASFTNASQLVITDKSNPRYLQLMTCADAGINAKDAETVHVVIDAATGKPAANTACKSGKLGFEGKVNGIKVRAAYLFLKDSAYEHTMQEYSEMCGVPVDEIERIAKEFTSHGTKASARGIGSTLVPDGVNATQAFRTLNALIGSNQMKGGLLPFRASFMTVAPGPRYSLAAVEGAPQLSGTYIARAGKPFSATDEYKSRVAAGEKSPQPKLPWFTNPSGGDNQAVQSILNQYPYQAKILLTWMNNSLMSTPGASNGEFLKRVADPDVIPLHIACDCFIGEGAQYADYIVPDTTPYESFAVVTQEGHWAGKGNAVRWPVKAQETIELDDGRHASFEAFVCDVAKECGVPGFGDGAITAADGSKWPLDDACDFFMKAFANLAFDGDAPVDDITDDEVHLQALDELPEAWRKAVTTKEWPKVQKILSRGGRFRPIEEAYTKDGRAAYGSEYESYIYSNLKAAKRNDYSGERTSGVIRVEPATLADNSPMTDSYSEDEYPLRQCNYKPRFRTTTMNANSPIMRDICASNYIEVNIDDAVRFGIEDGDQVRVSSPEGESITGRAMVRAGVAQGTFGTAFGYGHMAYGAQDIDIDGNVTPGDEAIATGVQCLAQRDPKVTGGYYLLSDNDTGCPARCGGMFKIEKA